MRETSEQIPKNFICPKLKPIRKSLGWTQARMAEELMMDVRSYIDLEHKGFVNADCLTVREEEQ